MNQELTLTEITTVSAILASLGLSLPVSELPNAILVLRGNISRAPVQPAALLAKEAFLAPATAKKKSARKAIILHWAQPTAFLVPGEQL